MPPRHRCTQRTRPCYCWPNLQTTRSDTCKIENITDTLFAIQSSFISFNLVGWERLTGFEWREKMAQRLWFCGMLCQRKGKRIKRSCGLKWFDLIQPLPSLPRPRYLGRPVNQQLMFTITIRDIRTPNNTSQDVCSFNSSNWHGAKFICFSLWELIFCFWQMNKRQQLEFHSVRQAAVKDALSLCVMLTKAWPCRSDSMAWVRPGQNVEQPRNWGLMNLDDSQNVC